MSRLKTLTAWTDTRLAMRMGAAALERRRERLWLEMQPVLARTPMLSAYRGLAMRDIEPVDPLAMRADIEGWNSAGIKHEQAVAAASMAEDGGAGTVIDDITAGFSTGTNGTRGIFLASGAERARYIGQSVAKLLPVHSPLTGGRIALVLRADSQLYRDSRQGRFSFMHLPLGMAAANMGDALEVFRPTVLIAPPRELAEIAASGRTLPTSVQRILWGSEPMAPSERASIGEALGGRPDPIYQATEGFIGAACAQGTLHLNDDSMDIELEPVAGTDAFRPIVTDLRRHVQPMVRVRMDDLIRPTTCTCGSACRAIEPVLGRVGDVWCLADRIITPEAVDDHLSRALPPFARWRVKGGPGSVCAQVVDEAHAGMLHDALKEIHADADVVVETVPDIGGAKRRRVAWEGEKP